ncbi:PEPxxWA-CTERM sorting domain-containing protein [Phenylobacterium sp.]|uniref:PEPxxWA-CTERM sorting domain-containing protein n=1 Tax=Phenylobacterium sp. TaxID=1871053 RepID=UPI0025EA3F70|nr:PEPxxWA-CTERM sorting domain-containing protein [Phenylobacterium sp.]
MRLRKLLPNVALMLAVCLSAAGAQAAVVIRNATGMDANDFHILFSGPADKLKITSSNFKPGVSYPPPSAKQNQIDLMGGTVKNGNQFTINNLAIGKGGVGLSVVSWFFTLDGDKLDGDPLVNIGSDTYVDMATITAKGFSIRPVPEPAVWSLMILGFGLAGAALRRQAFSVARCAA